MKKKGFTLIELLAVIIILAVIALIATPVILNVVENARRSAFQQSANGYYDAARYLYDELYLNNDRQDLIFTFEDKEQISSNENYKLQAKGQVPKGGVVYLGEDGQIMVSIHNGKYCATTDRTGKVNISEDIENCANKITNIPEYCWNIINEPLANTYGYLDGSEEWMNENYNMLYYASEDGCPTDIDVAVLPSEVNNQKVDGIGSWALSFNAKTIIISSGIKMINDYGFNSMSGNNLKVVLPHSLMYVGDEAFSCTSLQEIKIPSSIKAMGAYAFGMTFYLASVILEEGLTTLGYDSTFAGNQLTHVEIPSSVTSIGQYVFTGNKLENVTIPSSVTSIGKNAFSYNQLTSISIPDSVTTIEEGAFANNQLADIEIPSSVTSIGNSAFENNKLTSVTIPNSITTIKNSLFRNNQLTSVNIPGSVVNIEHYAFADNQLASVNIPNSVTSIGNRTFYNNQLVSVVIPDTITDIGIATFSNNKLTSVTIPNSVTTIGVYAFNNNKFPSADAIIIEGDAARFDANWIYIGFPAK